MIVYMRNSITARSKIISIRVWSSKRRRRGKDRWRRVRGQGKMRAEDMAGRWKRRKEGDKSGRWSKNMKPGCRLLVSLSIEDKRTSESEANLRFSLNPRSWKLVTLGSWTKPSTSCQSRPLTTQKAIKVNLLRPKR